MSGSLRVPPHRLQLGIRCAGDTLLHEAVSMSSRVGLTKPNDHIVVVQMISDSLVVKVCTLLHPIAQPPITISARLSPC